MAAILPIAGKQWLAGMTWRSYDNIPDKQDLLSDAEQLDHSWAAVRIDEEAIQAGFCAPIDGMKRPTKVFSLAAMLADSREQPWLGIFKIREGLWWYIAVRDGHAVLPDGDVIGGEEEIRKARDNHAGYGDWKYFEGDIDALTNLIKSIAEKPTPVKSLVASNLPLLPITVAAMVVVGLAGGYMWWDTHQQEAIAQAARAKALAMVQLQGQQLQNQPPTNTPLISKPTPDIWLSACEQVIGQLPLAHHGWEITQVGCDLTAVNVHWVRKNGATVANRPEGDVSADGEAIHQSISLTLSSNKSDDDAIDLATATLALRAWTQAISAPLQINQAAAINAQQDPNLPPSMPHATVSMDISISPFELAIAIPGLRLTNLNSTAAGWNLKGVIYGR
ncbi:MAG: type 4b pilus protein PilO2 [Ottowia sp.]|nr:type 4b pilus protein PilO2 [Ottowia sp.]